MGEIHKDGNVLVIRRIHVRYRLDGVPEDKVAAATRAHDAHADRCPVARSIRDAIAITTELDLTTGS